MKRWFGLTMMTVGLSLGACSSKKETKPVETAPVWSPAADSQAIVGTWSDGKATFNFGGNGQYTWSEVTPCGAPTCNESQRAAGSYQFRQNRIILGGALGSDGDLSVTYSFSNQQNTIALSDGSKSWTLNRR